MLALSFQTSGFSKNRYISLVFGFLGPGCCVWAFSGCGKQGLLLVLAHGLLIAVAPLVVEHRL